MGEVELRGEIRKQLLRLGRQVRVGLDEEHVDVVAVDRRVGAGIGLRACARGQRGEGKRRRRKEESRVAHVGNLSGAMLTYNSYRANVHSLVCVSTFGARTVEAVSDMQT